MPAQVAILHGWSDNSRSFEPLADFLRRNGYKAVPIWLGDYRSMDDDVRIEDVAKRMERVVQGLRDEGTLTAPFDLIVHSTGGLVARQWLSTYFPGELQCPVKRLVMLAPANFGSRLAALGQSLLGRVLKGWDNWFHTGKQMLQALELASPFQWELAQRDLFSPEGSTGATSVYGPGGVWPFILVGTHPYPGALKSIVNEDGGDGTVRVPAANLNARGITIDFSRDEGNPARTEWALRHGDILFPIAVLPDRTHSSIVTPDANEVASDPETAALLGKLLLEALQCEDFATYRAIADRWAAISEDTADLARDQVKRASVFPASPPEPTLFHQYLQVLVRVEDDHGAEVSDYFLEFFSPDSPGETDSVFFHREVLEDVHVNGERAASRCLYVDRTDLIDRYYPRLPEAAAKAVALSISASPAGANVHYFADTAEGAKGHTVVHREDANAPEGRWLRRNCTHLVRIIIPRNPGVDVFGLKLAG